MKLNSLRSFGIELESHPVLSGDVILNVIKKHARHSVVKTGWQQTDSNDYWHLKTDSTCGGGSSKGWEIASFKASGNLDLIEIINITRSLRKHGLRCGEDCGFHVHVDISDFTQIEAGILLAYWIKIEKILLKAVPRHRVGNKYCRAISPKISEKRKKYDPLFFWNLYKPKDFSLHNNKDKKVTMNLVNYATCVFYEENKIENSYFCDKSRKTVEFRFPEGTFDEKIVKNWILFFINFIDGIKGRKMPNDLFLVGNLDEFCDISNLNNSKLKKWILHRIYKFDLNSKWKKMAKKEVNTI